MSIKARYLHEVFKGREFHVKHQYALEGYLHLDLVCASCLNVNEIISRGDRLSYYVSSESILKYLKNCEEANSQTVIEFIVHAVHHDCDNPRMESEGLGYSELRRFPSQVSLILKCSIKNNELE